MRETPKETEGSAAEKKVSATRKIFLVAALILAGSLGASLMIYIGGTRDAFVRGQEQTIGANPELSYLQRIDQVVLKAGLVASGGWLCFFGSLLTAGFVWRRRWRKRM